MSEMIRVVAKQPGASPRTMLISNRLESLQNRVGGYIETVSIFRDVVMICNEEEEGKLKRMAPNFLYGFGMIVGPVVFAGTQRDKLVSLTPEQIEKVLELIKEGEV